VLRPDSNFFRYFGDPTGKSMPDGTATVPTNPPHASSAVK